MFERRHIVLAFASGLVACGQRGPVKTIDEVHPDVSAPRFVATPTAEATGAGGAQIVFSFNEAALGALVVRPAGESGLSLLDIDTAKDRVAFKGRAFETVRLMLADLAPDTDYLAHLSVRDESGNKVAKPVDVPFHTPAAVAVTNLSGDPIPALQGVPWSYRPVGIPTGCKLFIKRGPAWIRLSAAADAVEGIPTASKAEAKDELEVALSGDGCNGTLTVIVSSSGDPFFVNSWHMNPDARDTFSWFGAPPVIDLHLGAALATGVTGKGVRVTIVDSGMQVKHPDLAANADLDGSINARPIGAPNDPTPSLAPGAPGDQGTAVAGIIAAVGWNGIGGRGIAPGARISAYNLFAEDVEPSDLRHLRVFSILSDIVAQSGAEGPDLLTRPQDFDFDGYEAAQRRRVQLGRDGHGTIYVKAAGDLAAHGAGATLDQRNHTIYGMLVGSFNSLGFKSSQASVGANLWVSAPGGERGYQSDRSQLKSEPAVSFYPSVIAPNIFNDEFPCSVGYAKSVRYFDPGRDPDPNVHNTGRSSGFNLGWHPLNEDCHYTATVPATPAATGVVAGIAALILEARPEIGWRELKYVIARTAQPIDPDRPAEFVSIEGTPYEAMLPWVTNAAGFRFNNAYGFGAVDAGAALALATSPALEAFSPVVDSNWLLAGNRGEAIPPGSIAGVFSQMYQVQDLLLESVQVRLTVSHPDMNRIAVELISPSGTRSVLKRMSDGAHTASMRDVVLLSNAFYGERARGVWQLRVVDSKPGSHRGTLNSWYLRVTGHRPGKGTL